MARTYEIQRGDTLSKVAFKCYGDQKLVSALADFNGICNPDLIILGQIIEIPPKYELTKNRGMPKQYEEGLLPPHGLDEIKRTFGNIYNYIKSDGNISEKWGSDNFDRCKLPFHIPLSWDQSKFVKSLYCHVKLKDIFISVFDSILKTGMEKEIKTFGGCYNYRVARKSTKLSTHCWGISIDLNPQTNPMGSKGDMHPKIIEIFREHGFKWGGDWSGKSKDPMHFQFCTGY